MKAGEKEVTGWRETRRRVDFAGSVFPLLQAPTPVFVQAAPYQAGRPLLVTATSYSPARDMRHLILPSPESNSLSRAHADFRDELVATFRPNRGGRRTPVVNCVTSASVKLLLCKRKSFFFSSFFFLFSLGYIPGFYVSIYAGTPQGSFLRLFC